MKIVIILKRFLNKMKRSSDLYDSNENLFYNENTNKIVYCIPIIYACYIIGMIACINYLYLTYLEFNKLL